MLKSESSCGLSFAIFGALLAVAACSGGGGGSAAPVAPTVDLTGEWSITEQITSASGLCAGEVGRIESYTLYASQTGSSLGVSSPAGTFSGTVSGNRIQWTGSYPEDGGTTTITSMAITATNTSLQGTTNWSWTDGSTSCSGQTRVTGMRVSPARLDPGIVLVNAAPDTVDTILVLVAAKDAPRAEAEFATMLQRSGDTSLSLPPGTYDIYCVTAAPGTDANPDTMAGLPLFDQFLGVEIAPGRGLLLVVDGEL